MSKRQSSSISVMCSMLLCGALAAGVAQAAENPFAASTVAEAQGSEKSAKCGGAPKASTNANTPVAKCQSGKAGQEKSNVPAIQQDDAKKMNEDMMKSGVCGVGKCGSSMKSNSAK